MHTDPYSRVQSLADFFQLFRSRFFRYLKTLQDVAQEALLLVIITFAITTVVFFLAKMMWQTYLLTYVGKQFASMNPEQVKTFSAMASLNTLEAAGMSTLVAFCTCFGISIVSQFLHIARRLYYSRGFFGKALLWGLPLSMVVAICMQAYFKTAQWQVSLFLSVLPTLCVFSYCFNFSQKLIPEFGTVLDTVFTVVKRGLRKLLKGQNESNTHTNNFDDN